MVRLACLVLSLLVPSFLSLGCESSSCGAVFGEPAIVSVRSAATGAAICNPVIKVVHDGGASGPDVGQSCRSDKLGGCPTTASDGGSLACIYVLSGLEVTIGYEAPVAIEVSAPGFASKVVPDVMSGRSGCVPMSVPASQVTVLLEPSPPDAGHDAARDGA